MRDHYQGLLCYDKAQRWPLEVGSMHLDFLTSRIVSSMLYKLNRLSYTTEIVNVLKCYTQLESCHSQLFGKSIHQKTHSASSMTQQPAFPACCRGGVSWLHLMMSTEEASCGSGANQTHEELDPPCSHALEIQNYVLYVVLFFCNVEVGEINKLSLAYL